MAQQEKETEQDKKPKKVPMPLSVKFAIFSVMVSAAVFFPTTVIFITCMLPTLVAAIVDREPQRTMWITIGGPNLAGTIPAWFTLWSTGHNLDNAISILAIPSTLLTALGGAGIGWVIYQNVTPFVAAMMVRKNEKRLKDIDKRQRELMKRWGDDIAKSG